MCGFAGILVSPNRAIDPVRVREASASLLHRGPDDEGIFTWSGDGPGASATGDIARGTRVALTHRRLSIVDLTRAGHQPMLSSDGRHALVYNGEIYNYRELREELEDVGRRFRSRCDTEVLLEALREWGPAALPRLVGMFAFAFVDTERRTILLGRDPFGIKPLYVAWLDRALAFASEIQALLTLAEIRPTADPQRLYHYLRFGLTDHGEGTLIREIRQLPAAHVLEVSIDDVRPREARRYWELRLDQDSDLSFHAASERLRDLFLESVRLHLRSDVPLGAALSGGIDSSSILLAMRAIEGASLDLHAVSYLADDPGLNEGRWVELAARAANASTHLVEFPGTDLMRDLDRLIVAQGEPFGSTSIYAQYRVFRAASDAGLKVMLDGQGADELLGGYRFYVSARVVSLVRQGRWREALDLVRRAGRLPETTSTEVLRQCLFHLLPRPLYQAARAAAAPEFPRWLEERWFRERGCFGSPFHRTRGANALREELESRLSETSLPMLLRYEDRNSMAFSIESRVPFLTPPLAAFVFSLPEEYILSPDGLGKRIFRQAMRGIVPDEILDRRDKIGFATPERGWLAKLDGWVRPTLGSASAKGIGGFRADAALEEWSRIVNGRSHFGWQVWRWINLVRWAEIVGVSFDR